MGGNREGKETGGGGGGGEESQGIVIRSSNNRFGHSQAHSCKHKNRNGQYKLLLDMWCAVSRVQWVAEQLETRPSVEKITRNYKQSFLSYLVLYRLPFVHCC
jgi:hypothetical protein